MCTVVIQIVCKCTDKAQTDCSGGRDFSGFRWRLGRIRSEGHNSSGLPSSLFRDRGARARLMIPKSRVRLHQRNHRDITAQNLNFFCPAAPKKTFRRNQTFPSYFVVRRPSSGKDQLQTRLFGLRQKCVDFFSPSFPKCASFTTPDGRTGGSGGERGLEVLRQGRRVD